MKVQHLLAGLIVGFSCTGCDQYGTSAQTDATVRQQAIEYERQLEASKKQMEETERQLALSAKNLEQQIDESKRFEALMGRWETQADRVDKIIAKWEKFSEEFERRMQGSP